MLVASIDTETTGVDFFHGCAAFRVGICDGDSTTAYEGSVNPYTREVYWDEDELKDLQEHIDKLDKVVFHNTQFDMRALESIGIDISGIWPKIEDTLLCAHLFASGDEHGLKESAVKYFGWFSEEQTELEQAVKVARLKAQREGWSVAKLGMDTCPGLASATKWWAMDFWLCQNELAKYHNTDCEQTLALWYAFKEALNQCQLWGPYKLRKQLLKICYDITTNGMRLNITAARKYCERLETKINLIRRYLTDRTGTLQKFNWDKKAHLSILLHNTLKLPRMYVTASGLPSTNKKAIEGYAETFTCKELNALQKGRLLSTKLRYALSYLKWCDDDGYIHSNLNVTGTRETRQSSTGPNQQNITGELQRLFEPPPGKVWVEFDFVNIELRLWAYAVNNEELIEAFKSGKSVHKMIMQALYPIEAAEYDLNPEDLRLSKLYRNIKGGNFALIYGAAEKTSDDTYGYKGATKRIYDRFPGIKEYTDNLVRQCEDNANTIHRHCVYTLLGYPLDVPTEEPFKACNYYIQGSAGMIMTAALIKITANERYIDSESSIYKQVHDSAGIEIPIHKGLGKTIASIEESMATCVMDTFGPTPVDYKIKYNREDEENPHLIEALQRM